MDEQEARRLRSFAEEAGRGLRELDAGVWRERLQRRYRDLEAAFDWLLDHGHPSDALRMACTLAEFLRIAGKVATGRAMLHRALAAAGTDDRQRAVALYEDGMLAFWQGADEEACAQHGRSLQLARRLGDPTAVALALCGLARVALREDLDWARTLCEEALAVVVGTGDRLGRADALHVLGVAAQMRGDLAPARDLMTGRIQTARELGDVAAVASESANLSVVERQLGKLAAAEELAREALRIAAARRPVADPRRAERARRGRGGDRGVRAGGDPAGRGRRHGGAAGERLAAGRGAALPAQPRRRRRRAGRRRVRAGMGGGPGAAAGAGGALRPGPAPPPGGRDRAAIAWAP
jgi:tetratricopeptide (TPR) repeat protein